MSKISKDDFHKKIKLRVVIEKKKSIIIKFFVGLKKVEVLNVIKENYMGDHYN